jgi:hypothetical protein
MSLTERRETALHAEKGEIAARRARSLERREEKEKREHVKQTLLHILNKEKS